MVTQNERDISVIKKIVMYCNQVSEAIERFGDDYEIFSNDAIYVNAVSMPIMQIGEWVNRLSENFTTSHSNIQWKILRAMRNWFAHNLWYGGRQKIWDTANNDLPALRKFCEEILKTEE